MKQDAARALMIYNPYSGKRRRHRQFPLLWNKLLNLGYKIELLKTMDQMEIDTKIRKACAEKWDVIFIAGGDGTVNKIIQILAAEAYRPKLGIFPFGTSNEFAKFIGMPADISQAVSVIENHQTQLVDIGKFGDRYLVNIAAAGWLADIIYETPFHLKFWLGEFGYFLYFTNQFLRKHQQVISLRIFPDTVVSDISFFMIMNGNSVGPFERLIPDANLNDNFFHLITCKKTTRIRLLYSLTCLILKGSDQLSLLSQRKIQSLKAYLPAQMALNLDGEQAKVTEMEFQVIPHHLHVFSPQ